MLSILLIFYYNTVITFSKTDTTILSFLEKCFSSVISYIHLNEYENVFIYVRTYIPLDVFIYYHAIFAYLHTVLDNNSLSVFCVLLLVSLLLSCPYCLNG